MGSMITANYDSETDQIIDASPRLNNGVANSSVPVMATLSDQGSVKNVIRLTQAQYDALATKDGETLYLIAEGGIYLGAVLMSGAGGGGGGLTTEQVHDAIAGMLVEGSGVTLTYDDVANTLTIASTGGGASTLASLTDIAVGSQTTGQSLVWDGVAGKWKPGTVYASAAPEIGSLLPRLALIEGQYITDQKIGAASPVSGAAMASQTYVVSVPIEHDGYIRRIFAYGIAAGTLDVRVFKDVAGTLTYQRGITLTLVSGSVNEFTVPTQEKLEVQAGDYLGFYSATACARTTGLDAGASPTPYWAVAGNNTSTFAKPAEVSTVRLELQCYVAKRLKNIADIASDSGDLGFYVDEDVESQTLGVASPATAASSGSAVTYVINTPLEERARISAIQVFAKKVARIKFKIFEDVAGVFTWRQTVTRDLTVGLNVFNFPTDIPEIAMKANYYIGWYAPAGVVAYASVSDSLTKSVSTAGDNETSFTPGAQNVTNEHQIRFDLCRHKSVSDRVADDQIKVVVVAGISVKTYYYSGAGYWTEYEIEKATTTGTANGGSFNGWRSKGLWKCRRSRSGSFFRLSPITARPAGVITSEMDHAVQTLGAADFVGGYFHGFDQMSSATFVIDGEVIDASVNGSYIGQRLEFRQAGTLYMHGTDVTNTANKLADYVKSVSIADRAVTVSRESMTWLRDITITKDYIGMLPLSRGDSIYGSPIDRISRPTAWSAIDISALSGSQDMGAYARRTSWGAASKLRTDSVAAGFSDASRASHVEVNSANVKIYFAFLNNSAVTNGSTSPAQSITHKIVTGA